MKGGAERRLPLTIVLLQLMTSLVMAAGLALFDTAQAQAALVAGVVCVVPGAYFAWRAVAERSPARLLGHGVMKPVLTLTLMALAFAVWRPRPLGFFATFVVMQAMYIAGPVAFGARDGRHTD